MCGIIGIFERSGRHVDNATLTNMARAIHHRGPDHRASMTDGPVGLGYTRLSILDLSPAGNQPMYDTSGDWIGVYNGEVYNFQELRSELITSGVRFRSSTDTEVVLNLFSREGVSGLRKLNGMFAFAVWSKSRRELWVVRDPIGVKPLYYRLTPSRLVFASEMKAIWAAGEERPNLSGIGLANYLSYGHAVAPDTIFEDVYKLEPGHYLHAKQDAVSVTRYYSFPVPEATGGERRSEGSWLEEAEAVLQSAIKRQLIADVPVGIFLSGGIDSGLVLSFAAAAGARPKAFTVSFGDRGYDESVDARRIAAAFGAEHTNVRVTERDLIDSLETVVHHYDEPFADASGVPVYLMSAAARSQVKVALSGEGGDEMFAGYRRYSAERFGALYSRLPSPFKAVPIWAAKKVGRARRLNRTVRALAIRDSAERYRAWLEVFDQQALRWLLDSAYAERIPPDYDSAGIYRRLFANCPKAGILGRACYADAQTWLPDTYLEKMDKASMAVSLEVRVPLLDLEVVRFSARLPEWLRIRRGTSKYLLRRLAKKHLPAGIAEKPKRGLAVPIDPWFRARLSSWITDVLLDDRTLRRGLFRKSALEKLIKRHTEGRAKCETELWTLLMLELWFRTSLDSVDIAQAETVQVPS